MGTLPLPLAGDIGGAALLTISFPTTLLTHLADSHSLAEPVQICLRVKRLHHFYPDRGVSEWIFLALQYPFVQQKSLFVLGAFGAFAWVSRH